MGTAFGAAMTKFKSYDEIMTKKMVRDSIKRVTGRRSFGGGGTVPCVACEYGSVRYHIHRTGQIDAKCSTDGCVDWNERPTNAYHRY